MPTLAPRQVLQFVWMGHPRRGRGVIHRRNATYSARSLHGHYPLRVRLLKADVMEHSVNSLTAPYRRTMLFRLARSRFIVGVVSLDSAAAARRIQERNTLRPG